MEDQGIILGPPLRLKDTADGGAVQTVGPQPVDRLCGKTYQPPLSQNLCGGRYLIPDFLLLALDVP